MPESMISDSPVMVDEAEVKKPTEDSEARICRHWLNLASRAALSIGWRMAWAAMSRPRHRLPASVASARARMLWTPNRTLQAPMPRLKGVVSGVGRCQLCMMTVHERGMKLTARTQSNDWADDEFGEADFGDARPTQRLAVLARKISQDTSEF